MPNYNKLKDALSRERLAKYSYNANIQYSFLDEYIFKRYKFNMELSSELNKAIHIFEVVLRNAVVREWNSLNSCNDWPMNKVGISTAKKYEDMFRDIDKAIYRTKKRNPNNGDVISCLMLGFWKKMLSSKFDVQNVRIVKKIFPNKVSWKPKLVDEIGDIHKKIELIWKLRNRVAHHEPIFHLRDIKENYDLILEMIEMIDRDSLFLLDENKFQDLLRTGWDS